ncbi:MAG: hypothetical protein ACKVI4_05750 [Actinomycetales bacterium]|tara:strand:+ start:345 stop:1055 length:711 start_codon:yes stop_codon:yes gene_type:complete
MTMTRLWTVIGILAVVIILAGGYAVGVGPAYNGAVESDRQLSDVELQNQVKNAELDRLKELAADSTNLLAELEQLQLAVPASHNTSVFVRQLAAIAAKSDVVLSDVSYVSAEPALAPQEEVAPVAPIEGDEPAADAEAPTEVEAGSEENTQSVPSVPGLIAVAVSIEVEGSLPAVHVFLERVQAAVRTYTVGSITLDEGLEPGTFEFKTTGYVYVLPGAQVATSGVEPATDGTTVG